MRVAGLLAGVEPGRIDLALERRARAALGVEVDPAVDVLEQAAHPSDHHVAGAEFGLGVTGLEDPALHRQPRSSSKATWSSKHQLQLSPGWSEVTIGWPASAACLLACRFTDESQQPTLPQVRH